MEELVFLVAMSICALAGFLIMLILVMKRRAAWAIGLELAIAAGFGAMLYQTSHPVGLKPGQSIALALIFLLPALIGGLGGILMGFLVKLRRDRKR
jgi:hypothetical protein